MSNSVEFHIPYLEAPSRQQNHFRKEGLGDSGNCSQSCTYEASEMDSPYLDPMSSPSTIACHGIYNQSYLQRRFSGNPLLQAPSSMDMEDHHSVCSLASEETSASFSDNASEIAVWSCQYCDRALFRTEHETMIHELTCPENASGPLVSSKKKNQQEQLLENKERRAQYVARLTCRKNDCDDLRRNSKKSLDDDSNKKSRNKKKRISLLAKAVRRITKRRNKKKQSSAIEKDDLPSNLDNYFSCQQTGGSRDSGFATAVTEDNSAGSADTYDSTEKPQHNMYNDNPFQEYRQLKPLPLPPQITVTDQSHCPFNMVDQIPTSLCMRPTSEQLMGQLGLRDDDAAKSAMELLQSRSSASSVDYQIEEGSWAEEEIQGIIVPNYSQYVDMAVTAFRRDVLNISDDLYLSIQSAAYRMLRQKITN